MFTSKKELIKSGKDFAKVLIASTKDVQSNWFILVFTVFFNRAKDAGIFFVNNKKSISWTNKKNDFLSVALGTTAKKTILAAAKVHKFQGLKYFAKDHTIVSENYKGKGKQISFLELLGRISSKHSIFNVVTLLSCIDKNGNILLPIDYEIVQVPNGIDQNGDNRYINIKYLLGATDEETATNKAESVEAYLVSQEKALISAQEKVDSLKIYLGA